MIKEIRSKIRDGCSGLAKEIWSKIGDEFNVVVKKKLSFEQES